MKGKTAFNAMEGIDPRYILEAAPDAVIRKGSKAPYIRILAVAATVAVLTAVAVLGAGILKQSGENPPVVPPVEETQDAHVTSDGETNDALAGTDETPGEETVPFESIGDETESQEPTVGIGNYDFVYIPGEAEIELPEAMQNMAVSALVGIGTTVDNVTVEGLKGSVRTTPLGTFDYNKTAYNRLTYVKGEYGNFYSAYDRYRNDEGTEIRFLQNTDLMTYYFKTSDSEQPGDAGEMTPERAQKISDAFLAEILPDEVLTNIPCVSVSQDTNNPLRYWVGYMRQLYGYNTDENILVLVDAETGTVKGYNGACVGKYNSLPDAVTKEALDKAAKKLEAEVATWNLTGLTVEGFEITTNTVGDVYMSMYVSYSVNEDQSEDWAQILLTRVE